MVNSRAQGDRTQKMGSEEVLQYFKLAYCRDLVISGNPKIGSTLVTRFPVRFL